MNKPYLLLSKWGLSAGEEVNSLATVSIRPKDRPIEEMLKLHPNQVLKVLNLIARSQSSPECQSKITSLCRIVNFPYGLPQMRLKRGERSTITFVTETICNFDSKGGVYFQ